MPLEGKWSEIVASKVIKMTPALVYDKHTEFFLGTMPRVARSADGLGGWDICNNVDYFRDFEVIEQTATWLEQGDLPYWTSRYPTAPTFNFTTSSTDNAVLRAQTSAWAELIQTYNLGEELAELHSTLEFGIGILRAALNPLATMKSLVGRNAKDVMNAWMQYRYALMPLFYSAQDIAKLVKEKDDLYKTVRRMINQEINAPEVPPDITCFYTVRNGSVTTTVTAKGRWDNSALRTLGQIGFNPVSTAWELIPLSFVVDWYLNFGEWLIAVAGQWTNLATQLQGCTAVRKNYHDLTYLQIVDDQRWTSTYKSLTGYTLWDISRGEIVTKQLLLKKETVNTYERTLFNEKDLSVTLSPFLNWKRVIDGGVLTINSLNKVLRKLNA